MKVPLMKNLLLHRFQHYSLLYKTTLTTDWCLFVLLSLSMTDDIVVCKKRKIQWYKIHFWNKRLNNGAYQSWQKKEDSTKWVLTFRMMPLQWFFRTDSNCGVVWNGIRRDNIRVRVLKLFLANVTQNIHQPASVFTISHLYMKEFIWGLWHQTKFF